MLKLHWFNGREASDAGAALASQIARDIAAIAQRDTTIAVNVDEAFARLLRRADRELRSLPLNLYKKAKFANSFKWGLLEKGVATLAAEEFTQMLLVQMARGETVTTSGQRLLRAPENPANSTNSEHLFIQGNQHFERGAYDMALASYQALIAICPDHADALANLGATFCQLGRYREAGHYFDCALKIQPNNPDILSNFGILLLLEGRLRYAQVLLRQALKLKPKHVGAQNNLGLAFVFLGRARDARARFQKVLRSSPRNADAIYGLGRVARMQGRFVEAETMFNRALEIRPRMPGPLAALAGIRKMQPSDGAWLKRTEIEAARQIAGLQEAELRFALGKYWDDIGDSKKAFENYRRANQLQKTVAPEYDRNARTRFVDDLMCVHSKKSLCSPQLGSSTSTKPVFVVGMMRSGTSLVEQIIASHASATGAGELDFWKDAVVDHERTIRKELLDESTKAKLAVEYLRLLSQQSANARRVVDKAPVNSDYLGTIHSVFPKARIVYMRRNPIDTCLSCYFQQFLPCHEFSMDLSDLAHYYREHHRLVNHWRSVLPVGTMLDVPYEALVADQEGWTRKILDFLELEWDDRCLQFHETKRHVATASFWQVRQKIFTDSVERWRNYERYVSPLRGLSALNW